MQTKIKFITHYNNLYGIKECYDYIENVKKTYTDIDAIIQEILAYIENETNKDIEFIEFEYPNRNLETHIKYSNRAYVGYKGTFAGNIKQNKSNPLFKSEIYGDNLFNGEFNRKTNKIYYNPITKNINSTKTKNSITLYKISFGRLETCTGGGGNIFSYYHDAILMLDEYSSLQKINKKYKIQEKIEKIKLDFESKKSKAVNAAVKASENKIKELKETDEEYKNLVKDINELEKLLTEKRQKLREKNNEIKQKARESVKIKYNYKKNLILPKINVWQNENASIIINAEVNEIYEEALKLQNEYPEYFV